MLQINLCDVGMSFGKKQVLRGCTLQAREGQVIGIVGENGTGKTTLLKVIAGLIMNYRGEVNKREFLIDGCAGIIERPMWWEGMTGEENVQYYLGDVDYYPEVKYWGLEDVLKTPVRKYSLGMKQKLAFVIAFASDKQLLVFDEPTNSLDQESVKRFYERLGKIKQEQRIVFMTTHIFDGLEETCDSVLVLKQGRIERELLSEIRNQRERYEFAFLSKEGCGLAIQKIEGVVCEQEGNKIILEINEERVPGVIRTLDMYDLIGVCKIQCELKEEFLNSIR